MTGEDVTAKLKSGVLNVSLEILSMVSDALLMSRSVMDMVVELFGTRLRVTWRPLQDSNRQVTFSGWEGVQPDM